MISSEELYRYLVYSGYLSEHPIKTKHDDREIFNIINSERDVEVIPIEKLNKNEISLTIPWANGWKEKTITAWNDGEFIYAYRLQKERARFWKTGETFIKDNRLCRTSKKIQDYGYYVNLYKLPIENAIRFEQLKGHNGQHYFRYDRIGEQTRKYFQQRFDGFPGRNRNGWWDSDRLESMRSRIALVMKAAPYRFTQGQKTEYIDIRLAAPSGEFLLLYTDGTPIADHELKELLKLSTEEYGAFLRKR